MINWLSSPDHFIWMAFYSIAIGFLPNILFYKGVEKVGALTAGLVLLLEPVISSITSFFIWNDRLTVQFLIGAGLILFVASNIKWKKFIWPIYKLKASVKMIMVAIVVLGLLKATSSEAKTLHIVEIVPDDESNYVISQEMKQVEVASKLAIADFSKNSPSCNFKINKVLKRGTEEEIFLKVSEISKLSTESDVLVGLSRSSFSRVGAKASKNSKLKSISIGASTTDLKKLNANFYSIAVPWTHQWKAIKKTMRENKCNSGNTTGLFDSKDHLSRKYRRFFKNDIQGSVVEFIKFTPTILKTKKCIFLAANFAQIEPTLATILKSSQDVNIFGIGDWNYYADEMKRLLSSVPSKNKWKIFAPTGWVPNVNSRSLQFTKRIANIMKYNPSPIAIYTYDAATVALNFICKKGSFEELSKKLILLRDYIGIASSNNFDSEMQMVRFKGEVLP